MTITSKDNERLKLVRKLHDKRWRDKLGLFFVEGEDAVAAAERRPVDLLWAGEDVEPRLLADVASAPHAPRVIGVYRRADLPAWEERDATLALWHVSDPGNVGTLIRTAEAFGAAVALSDGCADPTSPKALRASAGSIWRVPRRNVGRSPAVAGSRSSRMAAHRCRRSTCPDGSCSCSGPSATACRPRSSATSTRRSRSPEPSR